MPRASSLRLLLPSAALITGLGATTLAATPPFVSDSVPDAPQSVKPGKAWQEEQVQLPPWPQDSALIRIKLDGPETAMRYFIDSASLRTGRDGVVRYTVVARGGRGVDNVSFEGLRCTPQGRYKVFAFGTDGAFEPAAPASDWLPIEEGSAEAFRFELWRHYLCIPRTFAARPHAQQLRVLRSGRLPSNDSPGFLSN